jgi:hypothetical protein
MKRWGIFSVVAVACAVIVASEFLGGGSYLWGCMFGLAIIGGGIDWFIRARSDPAAGVDPFVFMLLTLLVMTQRFDSVAAWLTGQ